MYILRFANDSLVTMAILWFVIDYTITGFGVLRVL